MRGSLWAAAAATLCGGLVACGDSGAVSDLSYAEVQQAAAAGDQARFRDWFREARGQRVAWNGRVVEVAKEHGDDFVEITMLIVDLDGGTCVTTDCYLPLPPPPGAPLGRRLTYVCLERRNGKTNPNSPNHPQRKRH